MKMCNKQHPPLLVSLAGFALFCLSLSFSANASGPNFLIIYAEGTGWTSTSVQMEEGNPRSKSESIQTPNLERLATMGITFSRGYAPSPRCTPSRAGLLTGISPAALNMTYINNSGLDQRRDISDLALLPPQPITSLPASSLTYAELLQSQGYATAHFGKWHLGREDPSEHGFNIHDGANNNQGAAGDRNDNIVEYQFTTEKGIGFIREQVSEGVPFLLSIDHYPITVGRSSEISLEQERRTMDESVGMLIDELATLEVLNNTYIVFSADHGASGRNGNAPLSKGKGSLKEGGIRVPFIIAGPNTQSGRWSGVAVTALDIFPTIADILGAEERVSNRVEGGSLLPLLKGDSNLVTRPREELVFHFPHYDLMNDGPATAIMVGKYKLIKNYEQPQSLLFDLNQDPGESNNLASQMSELTADLEQRMQEYLRQIDAQMPTANRQYRK